ncbi:MAG: hypothetical protein A3C08_02930 [Candidatus Taylorbacteria bacterium RIFCSPHIGHO2_02_FULL_47_18]|uniref:HicB-like antitoxin of toxin-antitoxin system domain-containing protein n=1 Tax=Candidatus Taylorbacteria bacterium RIFCSPLOWO2_01_FULL_48_100 TaxID=1802322 RepID=A0A1G2NI85_9BACT|nr:MAG: hypothetical protein A2670_02215 [Candidatus Taylorbacteria bacterium RIFCSPHIGHO2_01_FULL_48_38]OHA27691.1 MAG: hypothetical protein A3C08_02930 [Candidatus Taylorbacteria bacterium RIFCSPHIGHO2_02_FULL_47_18]OHA35111.1 MAG: hypothetical protein A2938_01700 [Candidatus Taylorbacteria bacterium RIFCSPLOWO2_01_FULL_48_100]OHA41023.1 MAG: hypothetical protein A3J31_02945 [Candidatus Taylorbacteria bacterium RIFCSPLOWO2_02_FULL_48_16]OHA44806.1 MAG: hypothetical protein A3H13_02195 [Candid
MKILTYRVRIEPDEGGRGYIAYFPALPGCHTQGHTLEETIAAAREVLVGFLRVMKRQGKTIPVERIKKSPLSFGLSVRLSRNSVLA